MLCYVIAASSTFAFAALSLVVVAVASRLPALGRDYRISYSRDDYYFPALAINGNVKRFKRSIKSIGHRYLVASRHGRPLAEIFICPHTLSPSFFLAYKWCVETSPRLIRRTKTGAQDRGCERRKVSSSLY